MSFEPYIDMETKTVIDIPSDKISEECIEVDVDVSLSDGRCFTEPMWIFAEDAEKWNENINLNFRSQIVLNHR